MKPLNNAILQAQKNYATSCTMHRSCVVSYNNFKKDFPTYTNPYIRYHWFQPISQN